MTLTTRGRTTYANAARSRKNKKKEKWLADPVGQVLQCCTNFQERGLPCGGAITAQTPQPQRLLHHLEARTAKPKRRLRRALGNVRMSVSLTMILVADPCVAEIAVVMIPLRSWQFPFHPSESGVTLEKLDLPLL